MTDYLVFEDVLGTEQNREIYRLALSKRELFAHSRTSPNRLYPDWRRSTVIYDHEVVGVASRIEHEIKKRLPHAIRALGLPAFDFGSMEIQLTSHNDGEYFHWHTDNGSPETSSRVLTFVYYFHGAPKAFSGGELVIYMRDGGTAAIEPRNDSLVLFSSSMRHEVKSVSCPSKRFDDGRFTLNGWLRRVIGRRDDYFDAKIFSFPNRPGAAPDYRPVARATVPAPRPGHTSSAALQTPDAGTRALALLDLYSRLFRQSRQARAVDVRSELSGDEFYERYYFANCPVLLKGAMNESPAVRSWSPAFFATHYGSVMVRVTAERSRDPDYESNFAETLRTVSLREFVERIEMEPESNDYYLFARNFFFDHPALCPLRRDLQPPPNIIDSDDGRPGTVKMWFGPKGTVTPFHHDEHSILFAQIFGSKRFKLVPPFDGPRLYARRRFYSAIDPEAADLARYPEFSGATVLDIVAEPGDMLFLPVGWWHWVKALDVSISATFCSFRVEGGNTPLRIPPR
jgi:Rps23 Pro-64 3,4-dihydroxylase Tpa1-like proline 4-hydroxylase